MGPPPVNHGVRNRFRSGWTLLYDPSVAWRAEARTRPKENRMRPSLRLGVGLALGVSLASTAALAQTPAGRGEAHVLGFRAPDGDDDVAAALSAQLRLAARGAGYEVPDNSPAMEQEMAVAGCASTGPDCLHAVAADIHAPKVIYGSVTRIGRGRNASVNVEISLWDEGSRREVHRVARVLTRAQANNESALRDFAVAAVGEIRTADVAAPTPSGPTVVATNPGFPALQVQQVIIERPPPPRTPVLRYIGFGALGVGGALAIVGIVEAIVSSGQSGGASDATPTSADPYGAWARFQANVNYTRTLSASDVCNQASGASGSDAQQVRDLCASNSSARALGLGLGIGGAVLAAAGAVMVVLDRPRATTESAPAAQPAHALSRFHVSPWLGATSGVSLGYTF